MFSYLLADGLGLGLGLLEALLDVDDLLVDVLDISGSRGAGLAQLLHLAVKGRNFARQMLLLAFDDEFEVALSIVLQVRGLGHEGLDLVRPGVGSVEEVEVLAVDLVLLVEQELDALVDLPEVLVEEPGQIVHGLDSVLLKGLELSGIGWVGDEGVDNVLVLASHLLHVFPVVLSDSVKQLGAEAVGNLDEVGLDIVRVDHEHGEVVKVLGAVFDLVGERVELVGNLEELLEVGHGGFFGVLALLEGGEDLRRA